MVCFMYRRGSVGKMTWILLTRYRAVCICVCVHTGPSGMKQWSRGSTLETWMTLVSMFSSLDQQDNPLKTWCVPLVLSIQVCKQSVFFGFFFCFVFLLWADSVRMCGRSRADGLLQNQWNLWVETTFKGLNSRLPLENSSVFPFRSFLGFFRSLEQARAHHTTTNKYNLQMFKKYRLSYFASGFCPCTVCSA